MPAEPATDPFKTLGLEPRFDLEEGDIRRAWLARSAEAHPDRAGSSDEAARIAAALNHARATLSDPEQRARALLTHLGADTAPAQPAPDFLMEFMEAKEAADEAASSGDTAETDRLRAWAQDRRAAHVASVDELFRAAQSGDDSAAQRITAELASWRYAERFLEQLDAPQKETR